MKNFAQLVASSKYEKAAAFKNAQAIKWKN